MSNPLKGSLYADNLFLEWRFVTTPTTPVPLNTALRFVSYMMLPLPSCTFTPYAQSVQYVVAFDIETSGPSFSRNGILSIGASLQDRDSIECLSFQANLLLPEDREYDRGCFENFLKKNPQAHAFVQKEALPPARAMAHFCEFLDLVEAEYPETGFVSDNPSFDIAWLNIYLDLFAEKTHWIPQEWDVSGSF